MLHPIFSTAIQRPDLIVEHVSAYGALLNQEARAISSQLVSRAVACLLAVLCGSIFVSMVGIAVMLGYMHNQFHWVLVVVPSAALIVTIFAALKAKQVVAFDHFAEFKAQLSSDMNALRTTP
jgi:hypothetical protein